VNTGYKISGCSGTVLEKWINHLESYFWEYHIQENQREPVVYLCLEGPTGIWISELRDRDPPNSWEELKQRLRRGADAMAKETNQPRYFGIRQDGSVREYRKRFEALCLKTLSLPRKSFEEVFLLGLKPQLQAAVRRLRRFNDRIRPKSPRGGVSRKRKV